MQIVNLKLYPSPSLSLLNKCQYEEPEFVREQQQMNKFLKGLRKSPICRKEGFYCGTSFIMAIMDLEQSYMKLSDGKITERMHNDEKLTLVCTR